MADLAAFAGIKVELFLSGVWTDVTPDVRAADGPTTFGWGVRGSGPMDRLASTGIASIAMNNITAAGVIGRYSPAHANVRAGFALGIGVRISLTYANVNSGNPYYKWLGTIDDIQPVAGKGSYVSILTCVDWMDEAANYLVQGLPVQIGVRADQIITSLLAVMPKQPNATAIGTGSDEYAFAPMAGPDERYSAAAELARLTQSEIGLCVLRGGTTTAAVGMLTWIPRTALVVSPLNTSQGTIAKTVEMEPRVTRASVLNIFKVTAHPKDYDPTFGPSKTLYQHASVPTIDPGANITFEAAYTDPAQLAQRIGGYGIIPAVDGVDIIINSNAAGTGSNLYANFTVTITYGSDKVKVSLTNNGGTTGYLFLFRVQGFGLYDYEQTTVESKDTTSITAYGERAANLDLPYQADPTFAKNVGTYLLPFYKDPATLAQSFTFLGHVDDASMIQAILREPGDVITVQEDTTGINKVMRIMAVDLAVQFKFVTVTWTLSPMVDTADYWVLEEPGSALGTNTRVAL